MTDLNTLLNSYADRTLLRFLTCGSVDDGKSTLIGRLLCDAKGVFDDQLSALKKDSAKNGLSDESLNYALLLDGLKAEREQGITIDVAYRYFSTNKRKFIIADCPGHEQYTRNMATGASHSDLAVILVDAQKGLLPQTKRHAFIASLFGIQKIVIAVNKMDLVDYDETRFKNIQTAFEKITKNLPRAIDVTFIPLSAKTGENVARPSQKMPWFKGPDLLHFLENVTLDDNRNMRSFHFDVQYVIRPDASFRGFAGRVLSGVVRAGDKIITHPSGQTARVKQILTPEGEQPSAFAPQSIVLTLDSEIDISAGNLISAEQTPPQHGNRIEAFLVWMREKPLQLNKTFLMRHGSSFIKTTVTRLTSKTDISSLKKVPAQTLLLNEIGTAELETTRPLFFEPFDIHQPLGRFVLIDPFTNETAGAGLIIRCLAAPKSRAGTFEPSLLSSTERAENMGHKSAFVSLSGPEAVKAAQMLEKELVTHGFKAFFLTPAAGADSDNRALCGKAAKWFLKAGFIFITTDAVGTFSPIDEAETTVIKITQTENPENRLQHLFSLVTQKIRL